MALVAPGASNLQRKVSEIGNYPPVPKICAVTGGTGFVGLRLVEMLVERGAERVVAFDIVGVEELPEEVKKYVWKHPNIEYIKGDITKVDQLIEAFKGVDCVWHMAAAVGPFHPKELYFKVNYEGTKNVVEACKVNKVKKIVMSSSPSTRMNGVHVDGATEDELPSFEEMKGKYLQTYAETKAMGEKYCREACSDELLTIAVAPHQVYGPRDNLFMPNLLEAAGAGKLRIFSRASTGYGKNRICFSHVDNYCHGLILAERALTKNSSCKAKFYIVTDGNKHPFEEGYAYFWDEMDIMYEKLGMPVLRNKWKLPYWLMMPIAYISFGIGYVTGLKLRITPFTVKLLTMHRWFKIDNAITDLEYEPIISFRDGWDDTAEWFEEHWMPSFRDRVAAGNVKFSKISASTEDKIDIQAKEVAKKDQ